MNVQDAILNALDGILNVSYVTLNVKHLCIGNVSVYNVSFRGFNESF